MYQARHFLHICPVHSPTVIHFILSWTNLTIDRKLIYGIIKLTVSQLNMINLIISSCYVPQPYMLLQLTWNSCLALYIQLSLQKFILQICRAKKWTRYSVVCNYVGNNSSTKKLYLLKSLWRGRVVFSSPRKIPPSPLLQ